MGANWVSKSVAVKPAASPRNILVIKHGALGDFVLALPAMAAIRAQFPLARITLQTTPALVGLASICPYVDDIDPDGRPKGTGGVFAVAARIRAGLYDIVYDLQNSERTAVLHFLLPFGPRWNGIAPGAHYRVRDPLRLKKHVVERMAEQVALTGVSLERARSLPDVSWAAAKGRGPESLGVQMPYLMIAARASPGRAVKHWPSDRFAALCRRATAEAVLPVLLGAESDRAGLEDIVTAAPGALNLAGKTSLADLAALGAHAKGAIGNDTGPMFLAAAAGAPSVVFYSRHSMAPDVCAPRGPGGVIALSGHELTDISIEAAEQALSRLGVFA